MIYVDWQPETEIRPPVYMDTNVFVGATVRNHSLYRACAILIGNLLANQAHILVSAVSAEEFLWAMAKLCYCEINNQRSNANFRQTVYNKWRERIFETYGARMTAFGSMLQDWSSAGLPVEVIPTTGPLWNQTLNLVPTYMRQCRLTPADAFHLALAENYAQTFITADSGFQIVTNTLPTPDLTVLHVRRDSVADRIED